MRSRKPPPPAVDVRDSGRLAVVAGGAAGREGGLIVPAALDAGRAVVAAGFFTGFAGSSPCFATEAAVGAMRREGKAAGRVGDFGLGFLKPGGEMVALSL
jgi:hypothetical protein